MAGLLASSLCVSAGDVLARDAVPVGPPIIERAGPKPPWRARRRRGVASMRGRGHGLIDLKKWPAEPLSPDDINVDRFARALRNLCGWMPPGRPKEYATWLVKYAREFAVDPFLLGGFIFRQSSCLPRHRGEQAYGVGLARINKAMHREHVRRRGYHYWVMAEGRWERRRKDISRFAFYEGNFRRAEPSIYFAAALLSIYTEQCPAIDGAFGSVPHRHPVSHMVWGDRVAGAGAEDRILRARRRLLQEYTGVLPEARGSYHGLALHCPLDAPPRKVTSVMQDDRSNGRRRHKGIDFASTHGEPVRAVAAGRVVFAGIDRRIGTGLNLTPQELGTVTLKDLGPGGLFVMILHAGGVRSAYMHLAEYTVKRGQSVKAAEVIGLVGRSGMEESRPHLHFELHDDGRQLDPVPYLRPYLFLPSETYVGQRLAAEQERQRRLRRRHLRRSKGQRGTAE